MAGGFFFFPPRLSFGFFPLDFELLLDSCDNALRLDRWLFESG
jgi:hypothetical protein